MKNKKAQVLAHEFYMQVYTYIEMEYKPKYARLVADSDISERLVDLISQYYWGGNTVQFTAGQVVDLLYSKYKKK
jgi:hypothetical protein